MKKHPRILLALAGTAAAITVASCSVTAATYEKGNPVKVGLICLHDTNSTYDKNFIDGMNLAATHLKATNRINGDPIIKTSVAENNDCYTAAKDLVKQGCNVIFADSFGHEEFMLKAAKEWPTVTFCHATGTKAKVSDVANYHNAFASIYEGRFLAGAAAGLKLQKMIDADEIDEEKNMRDGNIILGYIGAYPYAEVISGYTSWFLGVKAIVPNIVMDVTFTESWYSVEKEQAAATMLYNRGAALISQHADSMGAPGECAKNHIPNVTYNIPTPEYNTYVAFSRINWTPYYETVVNSMFEGKAIQGEVNNNWTGTIGTGSVEYGVADNTPEADKLILEGLKAELVAGTRKVFDCATFTVNGEHLTSYEADVDDLGDYAPETQVIKQEGDKYYFNESALRSAPYFDINIDGITKLG